MKIKLSPSFNKSSLTDKQIVMLLIKRTLTVCFYRCLSVIFMLSLFYFSFAQTFPIDSMLNVLKTTEEDTQKVNILNLLAWEMKYFQPDSTILLATNAAKLALKINFKQGEANAYGNCGVGHRLKGEYTEALECFFKALKVDNELSNKKGIANWLGNIGIVYRNKGDYPKALDYNFNALKMDEELLKQAKQSGNTDEIIWSKNGIATHLGNIGILYDNQGNYPKALEYFFMVLKIDEELLERAKQSGKPDIIRRNKNGISTVMTNIGGIYFVQNDYPKALDYYFKALKMYEELGNKNAIALVLGNIGLVYHAQGDSAKAANNQVLQENFYFTALEYLLRALKIAEELGNKNGISNWLGNICSLYTSMDELDKAIILCQQSLQQAKEINYKELTKYNYNLLSDIYVKKNDYEKAFRYHQLYTEVKDSMFNEENSKQIAEMQTRYETEKKEKEIQLLQKDKKIQTQELNRQKLVRNAIGGGLLIVFIFALVLINRFLLIKKQKKAIEQEKEKSEKLLLNILPKDTAEELKVTGKAQPKSYEMATVMFTDFKGFTMLAEKMSAEELVTELDFVFKKFDEIISKYPIEKIKTIGDAYMCAGGLPIANSTNPMDVVLAALEIKKFMLNYKEQRIKEGNPFFEIRIGVHTGTIVAGVVGDKKFAYDIWGDTVNIASRMESSGEPGHVNISGETYKLLQNSGDRIQDEELQFTFRGKVKAKNKGEIEMYFVEKA